MTTAPRFLLLASTLLACLISCGYAETEIYYTPDPIYEIELQVLHDGAWESETHILPGESVSYRIVKAGTEDPPSDLDTRHEVTWNCTMEPIETTTLEPDSLTYSVTFGDQASSTESSGTHMYTAPGVYALNCEVEDAGTEDRDDGQRTASVLIVVEDPNQFADPPIRAEAVQSLNGVDGWTANKLDVSVGQPVYFQGDWPEGPSYDEDFQPDGTLVNDQIATYNWDFGDNTSTAGPAVSHAYTAPGCYVVSLTADDLPVYVDDPLSEPSQVLVRVFSALPSAPTVIEPAADQPYCSLTPLIRWTAQVHDQLQVKVGQVVDPNEPDDPESPALWDSGEVESESTEIDCAANTQTGEITCGLALQEGPTYYVFVRVHNALGWGPWSGTPYRFTVRTNENPPENISVDPASGAFETGTLAFFTATYSDYCRYVNISTADLLIDDSTLDKISGCYLRYQQDDGTCWLAMENGAGWLGGEGYTPGSANVLENEQVKVYLDGTSVTGNDATLSVTWKIEFKDAFVGEKSVALGVTNGQGLQDPDNFQVFGTINVEAASGPTSRITSPTNSSYVTSLPVTVSGSASDPSGIGLVKISTDGGSTWNNATGTASWTYPWEGMLDGMYTLKSRATNTQQAAETPGSGINVTVDTAPPQSRILEPLDGETITGSQVVVRGSAFDDTSGVSKVEVSFDGGTTWFEAQGTDFFIYTHIVTQSGQYTIKTRATDKAGWVEIPGPGVIVTFEYQEGGEAGMSGAMAGSGSGSSIGGKYTTLFESQKMWPVGPYSAVNLATGCMITTIPIVGWDSMGDLGIDFSLIHVSQRDFRPDQCYDKWMHSYQSVLHENYYVFTLYHPDGGQQMWVKNPMTGEYQRRFDNRDELRPAPNGGWIVTRKDQTEVWYTEPGRFVSPGHLWLPKRICQPSGQGIHLSYSGSCPKRLTSIGDPDGKRWISINSKVLPNGFGTVVASVGTFHKYGGNTVGYGMWSDDWGNILSVSYPSPASGDNPYIAYAPKSISITSDRYKGHRITGITDPNGHHWSYDYYWGNSMDLTHGNVKSAHSSSAGTTSFSYQLKCPDTCAVAYEAEVSSPCRCTHTYTHMKFDGSEFNCGRRSATDLGRSFWWGSRLYSAVIGGHSASFDWGEDGCLKYYTNVGGHTTSFGWDGDSMGNLESIRDPMGRSTCMHYTSSNQVSSVHTPTGREVRYAYDSDKHLKKSQVDPNNLNITTEYECDQYNNLIWQKGPYQAGEPTPLTTFEYGLYTGIWNTHTFVDKVTDPAGRYMRAVTDGMGNKRWETPARQTSNDPMAVHWWYYDKLGRPYRSWHSGDTESTREYWPGGQVYKETDENGYKSEYYYDGLGNLDLEKHEASDSTWAVTDYVHNSAGDLTEVKISREGSNPVPPRTVATYEYDNHGRMTKVTSHGVITRYEHDSTGNVTKRIDGAGNQTSYQYDGADRLYSVTYPGPGQRQVLLQYYADDALKAVCDWTYDWDPTNHRWITDPPLPAREYSYDTAGRLSDEIRNDLQRKIHFDYNGSGTRKLLQIKDMSDNVLAAYEYDYYPDNALKYVRDPEGHETWFYYDFRGRLQKKLLPNGAYVLYQYNDAKGPSGYANAMSFVSHVKQYAGSGGLLYDFAYTYDNVGNVLTAKWGPATTTYTYSRIYRLLSEHRERDDNHDVVYSYGYTYDPNGNRLTKTAAGVGTTTYEYVNDQLRTATAPSGVTSYEYDANGNLWCMTRGSEVTDFSYDYDNNLVGWTPPSGTPNVFTYNSGGERIRKEDSGGITNYLYAGGALLQELGPSGNVLTWYNPGISQKTGLQKMFFLHDRLGNTTRMVDISGSPTDAIFYDAWGNIYGRTGTTDTRYTYVGREGYYSDPDTGLIKLGARSYDPTIGRFITQDPSRDGLNWYAYAGDNPVNAVDPTGLSYLGDVGDVFAGYGDALVGAATTPPALGAVMLGWSLWDLGKTEGADAVGHEMLKLACPSIAYMEAEDPGEFGQLLGGNLIAAGLAGLSGGLGRPPSAVGAPAEAATTGNTEACIAGRAAHEEFKLKVQAKPGWRSEPRLVDPQTGRTVIPDATTPSRHPISLKPDTPTGHLRGKYQIRKYERATGKRGRVIYYKKK